MVSTVKDKIQGMKKQVKGVKDISMEEKVERITVGSEVAVVFIKKTGELVAVEVTLGEVEVLMRIFPVGEGEDLLTMEQIRKTNVVTTALDMVR